MLHALRSALLGIQLFVCGVKCYAELFTNAYPKTPRMRQFINKKKLLQIDLSQRVLVVRSSYFTESPPYMLFHRLSDFEIPDLIWHSTTHHPTSNRPQIVSTFGSQPVYRVPGVAIITRDQPRKTVLIPARPLSNCADLIPLDYVK